MGCKVVGLWIGQAGAFRWIKSCLNSGMFTKLAQVGCLMSN